MSSQFATSFISLVGIVGLAFATPEDTEKCYSCASANLYSRWPKDEHNNLLYLEKFPLYVNRTCDSTRGALPVVDCPNSACVKVVYHETTSMHAVCNQGPVVIRDCWSRVVRTPNHSEYRFKPPDSRRPVQLADEYDLESPVGQIYSCVGYPPVRNRLAEQDRKPMNQTYTIGQRPPRERSGSIDSDFAEYTIHGAIAGILPRSFGSSAKSYPGATFHSQSLKAIALSPSNHASRKAAQNNSSITRLFVNKLPSLEGCSPDRKCCQRPWNRTQFELAKYNDTLKNN
ncbi:Protein F41E6.17 [Aphelenchoides avenae]|nr:Protein F41E6.17 [Aphelenchus avenae]